MPAFGGALAWLTLEVLRRHGITATRLGIVPTRSPRPAGHLKSWQIAGYAVLACVFCARIATMARSYLPMHSAPTSSSSTSRWEILPDAVYAVALEDLVIVAAVAALLTAARRPQWEMYAIAGGPTVAVHLSYGVAALAFLPYALVRLGLYRRHGRLIPLITAHAAVDVLGLWLLTLSAQHYLIGTYIENALLLALALVLITR
jgi:hypothetical protein